MTADDMVVLAGLIAAGEKLIETADIVGEPIAAAHFQRGIDILREHLDDVVLRGRSSPEDRLN